MTEAYPLHWPPSWPRTIIKAPANFAETSAWRSYNDINEEIRRLGGKNVIVSSNLTRNRDGSISSVQRKIYDPGIAVYFDLDGQPQCFPCDRWDKPEHNLRAIVKSIEALRGLERWGAKTMVRAAFKGFQALPAPEAFSFEKKSDEELKDLLRKYHSDQGTEPDTDKFQAVLTEIRRRKQ